MLLLTPCDNIRVEQIIPLFSKRLVSMAKFDVEHESVNRFKVWWHPIPLKAQKFKMSSKWRNCKKMANLHTLLACNMSFCRFFGSRNTILKLLTLVSVHGWSYMAKLRNFDVKWCNFIKKWFNLIHYWLITRLYRGVWVKRQTFENLVVNFCTWLDLHGKMA